MKTYSFYKWVLCVPFFAFEAVGVEFNTEFLKIGEQGQADLSQFSAPDRLAPGNYLVDIVVNNNYYKQQEINFVENTTHPQTQPCLPRSLINTFGLKQEYISSLPEHSCLMPADLPGITARYYKNNGQLKITVPQSLLEYYDKNYTPPEQWDNGIAGLMMDYRIIGNTRQNKHEDRVNSLSAFGTTGANLGAWRFRGDYQFANYSNNEGNQSLDFNNIHAFRPLPSIKSQLTLGQTYLTSDIFDTLSYSGIKLASDERMLPPSLRGYAPRITGIAKTNAKVTVSQQGRTIYLTTVPPGPFNIQDLSSAVQGELQISVEEEDGSTSQFTVNTASVPFLTREGQIRYNTAMGKPTNGGNHVQNPFFTMGEISYGLSSTWSAYGGTILANDYHSAAVGLGKDLYQFGAVSLDVTQARATLEDQQYLGHSYRFNYAKRFDSLDADIRFFGYRFSDKKFISLSEFTHASNGVLQRDNKQRYSLVTAKQFDGFSTYLSYTHDAYWNAKSSERFDLSASTLFDIEQFKNVSLNISLSYNKDQDRNDLVSYLGISIPLEGQTRVSYNQQTGRGRFDQTVSLRQNRGKDDYYQLTTGGQQNNALVSGFYQHKSDAYQLGLSGSYVSDSYHSASANLSGSMVSTLHGSALHSSGSSGNTRLLVDTHGVSDVTFNNGKNHTNSFGYSIIDGAPPYENFEARVDMNNLPANAEAHAPIRSLVLTEGAIGYLPFEMNQGSKLLVLLKDYRGVSVPFGAEVTNTQTGKANAIVGEDGLTYLIGVKPESQLKVRWSDKSCTLVLPQVLPDTVTTPQPISCR
ncbi:fimbria/pilus outer membrane usher protein [Yersinia nurmii]|uniref:Fimbria/pilus outer membrane usher protein n=1 Tax=Yersinia nurmii TaxID=685706 RepID=A0AAW7KB43_9GAMM|nr:fimbria/pilus outer membrane usher protein [Yersinia nurmii]MDN0089296.1 fimbria/pilus outer membrane usher protein [Yersinia nurmii]